MTAAESVDAKPWRNADVDWDQWPVETYLSENYRDLHPCDDAVLVHHSAFYSRLGSDSIGRSLEVGVGPNLYPLMLAAAASRRVEAVDVSASNVAYVARQLTEGADDSWQPFYARCRALNPALPLTMDAALDRCSVALGGLLDVERGAYDLSSMTFVAESISETMSEVAQFCRAFVGSVRPGGLLVAAFMENQSRYQLGEASRWPGCPITAADVQRLFEVDADDLVITRIEADPTLPAYYGGYTGMIMLTGRRRANTQS